MTEKSVDFETHLNDIQQIENVLDEKGHSLCLNIGQLYYHTELKDEELVELNKTLTRYEHPSLFVHRPNGETNCLFIEVIHYIIEDLIDTVVSEEQAKIALEHYEKLKMTMFQSSKAEMRKFEKSLSLIEGMPLGRKLFLEEAKFKLSGVSPNSKKYFVAV